MCCAACAVLALLYRLLSQNKRLTHEESPPTSPAPADGTDIGSVVAAKKLAKNLRKKSKGDIETKELPRQVSRAASIRTNLVKDDDSSAWELKGEYAAFLSHYKLECAMEARHCQAELEGMLDTADDRTDFARHALKFAGGVLSLASGIPGIGAITKPLLDCLRYASNRET